MDPKRAVYLTLTWVLQWTLRCEATAFNSTNMCALDERTETEEHHSPGVSQQQVMVDISLLETLESLTQHAGEVMKGAQRVGELAVLLARNSVNITHLAKVMTRSVTAVLEGPVQNTIKAVLDVNKEAAMNNEQVVLRVAQISTSVMDLANRTEHFVVFGTGDLPLLTTPLSHVRTQVDRLVQVVSRMRRHHARLVQLALDALDHLEEEALGRVLREAVEGAAGTVREMLVAVEYGEVTCGEVESAVRGVAHHLDPIAALLAQVVRAQRGADGIVRAHPSDHPTDHPSDHPSYHPSDDDDTLL